MHAPTAGDDRRHLDSAVLDPNAPEHHVGEDSSRETAEPVEAIRQRRTATVLERTAADDDGAANRTADTGHRATHALEGAETGAPPRKSTRGGANHVKPDSQLQRRQITRASTPQARAARGK